MHRISKLLLSLVLLLSLQSVAANGFKHPSGLLFSVDKPGQQTSYIFATMHTGDGPVLNLVDPVMERVRQTGRLVLEVEMDAAALLGSMTAMILTDGTELPGILGDALYRRTVKAAAELGIPEMALRRFKPWAVATLLSLPRDRSGQFLDLVLYQQAKSEGLETGSLETAEEQLGLFETLSESDQVELLELTLEQQAELPAIHAELTRTYLAGDLRGLAELSARLSGEMTHPSMRDFQRRLIADRNHRMTDRLVKMLSLKPQLTAVGALHLPGEEGVLHLLEQRGYRINKLF